MVLTDYDRWPLADGLWPIGLWSIACGQGVWRVACGMWLRHLAFGLWSTADGYSRCPMLDVANIACLWLIVPRRLGLRPVACGLQPGVPRGMGGTRH